MAARDVEKAGEKVEELRKGLRRRQKTIKLAEDEKRIKKVQKRALKKKKQNAFKRAQKSKNSCIASSARSGDDRMLFRGMLTALSLCFSEAGKCSHSACLTVCVLLLCVSVLEKENIFPSYERSEGEGKDYNQVLFVIKREDFRLLTQRIHRYIS